jgi:hypothetical protein
VKIIKNPLFWSGTKNQVSSFVIEQGAPRIFNEPGRESFLPIIGEMARLAGPDSEIAISDALPMQFVIRAIRK